MGNLFKHVLVTIYHWGHLTTKYLHLHISIPEAFRIPVTLTPDFLSFFLHFHLVSQLSPATQNIHADTINFFTLAYLKNQSLINNKRLVKIKNSLFWKCIWEHRDKVSFQDGNILLFLLNSHYMKQLKQLSSFT